MIKSSNLEDATKSGALEKSNVAAATAVLKPAYEPPRFVPPTVGSTPTSLIKLSLACEDDVPRDAPTSRGLQPSPLSPSIEEPDLEEDSITNMSDPRSSPWHSLKAQSAGMQPPTLQIRTDVPGQLLDTPSTGTPKGYAELDHQLLRHSSSAASLPRRTPSIRAAIAASHNSAGSLSPGSVLSSPQLASMTDITPLPSPITLSTSSWQLPRRPSLSLSRASSTTSRNGSTANLRQLEAPQSVRHSRPKPYPNFSMTTSESQSSLATKPEAEIERRHARNRSLSEYVPDSLPLPIPQPNRHAPIPGFQAKSTSSHHRRQPTLQREEYLAVQRGLAVPPSAPPTPPRSTKSDFNVDGVANRPAVSAKLDGETYCVRSVRSNQPRRYRKLRELGRGAFSKVDLAVRLETDGDANGFLAPSTQKLVAVKVVQYGPAGGADEERIEVSLKREVEILKSVNHPSVVQLKAFGSDDKRALLVLDFCPGGDLFEVASQEPNPLEPELIRRIFAELVSAVRYLHRNYIVHRDIKLENVLVNVTPAIIQGITDWRSYDRAVITLSDLGLSRRIPEPPESPMLQTRCGSEDYAAPEILMGQPYDGRSTDSWALGVLLYAIMENRLPFDPLPGAKGDPAKLRARTPHRIARCEWAWYRYADSDGEWDPVKGEALEGARMCVEGLLKRNSRRQHLDEIAAMEWVRDAICIQGDLKRGDREVP